MEGVSHISAESWLIPLKDISTHQYIFLTLLDQLVKKYGEPAKFVNSDFLVAGKISDVYCEWGDKNRPSLINNLTYLELNFCRKNSFYGFFVLRFFYDNYKQALKIINLDDDAI